MTIIDGRQIGAGSAPYVIAEMSGNHNGSLDRALEIVAAAAAAGVHALKLQTYTADSMTIDVREDGFVVTDPNSLWYGSSLYELYQRAATPWEWHPAIYEHARALGLTVFSTPFDAAAVDFLESLGTPCYKIASFENSDLRLIRRVAATGKPVILSTGMATLADLDEAVRAAREEGCRDLILLKCTSTYPAAAADSNLLTIPQLRQIFDCEVGLSDHTPGIGVPIAAVALGATTIEKHFTLSRAAGGVDAAFSLEPVEMTALVEESARAFAALGQARPGRTASENASMQFRRSLYFVKDVAAGDRITDDNVRAIRPGWGLPLRYQDAVVGMRVSADVRRGTPVSWDVLR
jgi:pseudaminic acid synthase